LGHVLSVCTCIYDVYMSNRRLTMNLSDETDAILKAQQEKGHSYTDTVRRAVKLLAHIEKLEREGWTFEMNKRGEAGRIITLL
jgi:hypothetical protein